MSNFLLDCWRTFRFKRSLKRLRSIKADHDRIRRGLEAIEPPWYSRLFAKFGGKTADVDRRPTPTSRSFFFKSLLFFLIGILLSFSVYFFMIHQLNYDEMIAVYVCVPLIIFLPLALAFSTQVRCILLLAMPQIFSGKGRIVLLAYVFILAHNGPMRNAMSNFHVLVNSTVCLQNKIANLLPPFVAEKLGLNTDLIGGPDGGFEGVVEAGQEQMNDTMIKFKLAYISMESLFNETLEELDREYGWLKDKQVVCRKLKTKLNYIIDGLSGRLFESWRVVAFTPWLPTTVQYVGKAIVTQGFKSACGYEEAYDFFDIKALLRKRMNAIGEYVKQESNFSVHFSHHYSYAFNQSRSFREIRADIVADVLNTFSWIKKILTVVSLVLGSTLLMIFVKAIMYRRKYGKSPKFDNFYLSTELVALDRRRELMGLESVLPLKRMERRKYVAAFSPRLVPAERKKFMVNLMLLVVAALNVAYCVALDYAIYWFAQTLNAYGGITISLQGSVLPRLEILGDGILSSVFRGIAEAFDPFVSAYVPSVDLTPCLPRVNPPDYATYVRIGQLLLLSLLVIFLGSWLLRLRHVIAAVYNPSMKTLRAAWLHRKILIQRTYGLKKLRRNLRKSFLHVPSNLASGLLEYMSLSHPWFGKLLRLLGYRRTFCLVCGELLGGSKPLVKCDNVHCKGVYCKECYDQLKNLCPLCANPLDYGDDVEVSEECDSSDDAERVRLDDLSSDESSESDDDDDDDNDDDEDDDYSETEELLQEE